MTPTPAPSHSFKHFLHGAAVYPEFMPRDEWLRLLDDMVSAKMNTVRLLESAWGFLEPSPGTRRHGEAVRWLDDAHERGLQCVVGTGSFLPPQWFASAHPDALVLTDSGIRAHPLARKSVCIEHPAYREAVSAHIAACAEAWGNHPSVIAWQLDNEIDRINLDWKCHCPNCEAAWTTWLTARYGSVEALNERLRLDHWGLTLTRVADLQLPRVITEIGRHPCLASLEARFRRDRVSAFLREQARILRAAGIRHPLTHNFFIEPDFTAEEPGDEPFLDFGSFDLYLDWQPVEDSTAQLRSVRLMEQQRGCYKGDFVLMETSMGTVGGAALVAPSATASTYRRRLLLALASGARGVLYWTGTVWRGGPWIFHGALHDHAGDRIPEWDRIVEFGTFLEQHGPALLANPVRHDVAVIGSHAGNALASNYPVFPGSADLGLQFEDACRRRGLAVDILTPRQAASAKILADYKVVALFGQSLGLGSPEMVAALVEFVHNGGQVIIGPLAGYVSEEGTIANEGLAVSLTPLTGSPIPVFRWFGDGVVSVSLGGRIVPARHGFVESFHAAPADTIEATFRSADPAWDGRPAIVRRTMGAGDVWKYLAFPDCDDWPGLPARHELLAENLPTRVLGVPRTDGSLMLVNMRHEAVTLGLSAAVTDRFTGRTCGPESTLEAEAALWVGAKNSAV